MNTPYLDAVREGRNDWWRYLLSLGLMAVALLIGSLFLITTALALGQQLDMQTGQLTNPYASFVILGLSFWPILFALLLAVRWVHGRRILSLITPARRIDWKRVGWGFGVWFTLYLLAGLGEYLLHPTAFTLTFEPQRWLLFAATALVLLPIQTSTEELVFRGYLLQGLSLWTKRPVILAGLTAFLFMLLHLANPEVKSGPVLAAFYYFGVGFLLAWVTLKDNGLELALGMHAATNLGALLTNYKDSVLSIPAIFTSNRLDLVYNLVSFLVMSAVFLWIVKYRKVESPTSVPNHAETAVPRMGDYDLS
jgi:membrane protease YdiL (CAAX protease family)